MLATRYAKVSPEEIKSYNNDQYCYPFECITSCLIPSIACGVCCFIPYCYRDCRNTAEAYMLRHPTCMGCCQRCCYIMDLSYDCNISDPKQMFINRQSMYGNNIFCTHNRVHVWDQSESERLLLEEQDRGCYLGATDLVKSHMPYDEKNRKLNLLEMSGLEVGNNSSISDHKAFRNALLSLTTSAACMNRISPSNPVMLSITNKLKEKFTVTSGDKKDLKSICAVALPEYLLRGLTWAIFDMDLTDTEYDILNDTYDATGASAVLWHIWGLGNCMSKSNQENKYLNAARVYDRSPIIKNWVEKAEYNYLTKNGLLTLIERVITLAAIPGPYNNLANVILNKNNSIPKDFKMPIHDREKLRLVLLEENRINPAVLGSAIVTDKHYVCPFSAGNGKSTNMIFPPKTPVEVNFTLNGLNADIWHKPKEFLPFERNLWGPTSHYTMFNGVGDSGPRLCPGRDLALELMITALQSIYETLDDEDMIIVNNKIQERKNINTILQQVDPVTNSWIQIALETSNLKEEAPKSTDINVLQDKKKLKKVPVTFKSPYISSEDITLCFTSSEEENTFAAFENYIMNPIISIMIKNLQVPPNKLRQLIFMDSSDLKAVLNVFKEKMPKYSVDWSGMDSDKGMSLLAFHGLGQQYITKVRSDKINFLPNPAAAYYEIDLSSLAKYEVRPRYEKYGCISFFDKNKNIIGIWWDSNEKMVYPGQTDSNEWEICKAVFRSTLLTIITLKNHLVDLHIMISNNLAISAREQLSSNHPLRRFLRPFYYKTCTINYMAMQTLIPIHGIPFKGFAISAGSWNNLYYDLIAEFKYETFPEFLNAKELSKEELLELPIAEDGLDLWAIIIKFVTTYIDLFYPDDKSIVSDVELNNYWDAFHHVYTNKPILKTKEDLIKHLAHCIFSVTAHHSFIGGIIEYLVHPSFLAPRIGLSKTTADLQSFVLGLTLMCLTSKNQPSIINSWEHIHSHLKKSGNNETLHKSVIDSLSTFNKDLKQLSETIDKRNVDRSVNPNKKKFEAYYPYYLECSISL